MPESRCQWLALLSISLVAGCFAVDGGAAELYWSLRDFSGNTVDSCGNADLADVRLCWAPAGDDTATCRPSARDAFDCGERHGVTGFVLDPGPTAFWIEPVCDDGVPALPGTFQVPAPIVRDVEVGHVVTLSSLLIVTSDNRDEPCLGGPAGCTCIR